MRKKNSKLDLSVTMTRHVERKHVTFVRRPRSSFFYTLIILLSDVSRHSALYNIKNKINDVISPYFL